MKLFHIAKLVVFRKDRLKLRRNRIREEMHILRKQLSDEQKMNAMESVFKKIEQTHDFESAGSIMIYWSTSSELPTHTYIRKWSSEKTILIPEIGGNRLTLRKYNPSVCSASGKSEAKVTAADAYTGKIDLAIIPGVAFDKKRNRLGRGGGYYDLFLTTRNVPTYGVGFDFQIFEKLPVKWGSMKMKKIITPGRIIG